MIAAILLATCATIPTDASWPEMRVQLRPNIAYSIYVQATGQHCYPVIDGDELCFEAHPKLCPAGPTVDVPTIVTPQTMATEWASQVQAWAANQSALDAEVAAYEAEHSGTPCNALMPVIDTRIDALVDPVINLSQAKTVLKVGFKKLARCLRAHQGSRRARH